MKPWIPIFNPLLDYLSLENLLIMTKFLIILLALYILYYVGNIIYDLFLKKKSTLITEESDIFSLAEFEEQNRDDVTIVGIEDVENLNTPKSFNRKEFPVKEELSEEREDIEIWRKRFESEQNIDSFNSGLVDEQVLVNGSVITIEEEIGVENFSKESAKNINPSHQKVDNGQWYKMLNDAETIVQMISNNNGHKVYQTVMQ